MERSIAHAHAVADDEELADLWLQRAEMERAIGELTAKLQRHDNAISERVARLKKEMK